MIPVATNMTEVDNLPGHETHFSISDPRWVMRSMADLYSNRELAVAREYSTNAYDATIEAGSNEPIRVTLPSQMNPYFSVQDFGIGMSESDLKDRYTKFGSSTKRDSNDFNGMLGFGCKSAVAYTNTFTVTSVKNGYKTVAVITRKEDYAIVLKVVVPSVATTERNGTIVQVPVHNWAEFETKARNFYRFWKPGTVLVNGKEPKWAVGDKIGDGLYHADGAEESHVVMGNVAYRIANPRALFKKVNPVSFVAYVDNGAVEFTPSREDLKYSDHTKRALANVIDSFEAEVVANAAKEVQNAPNHAESLRLWNKWRNILGANTINELNYKGDPLVTDVIIDPALEARNAQLNYWEQKNAGIKYNTGYARGNTDGVRKINTLQALNAVVITGFPSLNVSSAHKKRAREWASKKGIGASHFYFVLVDEVKTPWISKDRMVSWEQVKIDVPPPPRPKRSPQANVAWGRKAGTFDLVSRHKTRISEQDVPNTKNLYYIGTQKYNDKTGHAIKNLLASFCVDESVVIVPANRLDKFLRNYPNAKPIMDELTSRLKLDGLSMVPDEVMERQSIHYEDLGTLACLTAVANEILDPEIKRLIRLSNLDEGQLLADYDKHFTLAKMLGKGSEFKVFNRSINKYGDNKHPLSKYPLLRRWYGPDNEKLEHSKIYINAVYSARKDGKNV